MLQLMQQVSMREQRLIILLFSNNDNRELRYGKLSTEQNFSSVVKLGSVDPTGTFN